MSYEIIPYQNTVEIANLGDVITLVQKQMQFIGYSQTREDVVAEIKNAMKSDSRSVLFVAYEQEDTAVGFAYGNICSGMENKGDYLWLNELYVSPECRNQGLGSDLLSFVQTWAKEKGCVYFAMVTHPANERAQDLYRSNGFELETLVWVDKYL
jgi:ribosomal protein S18 acetylase RimI-like enzyme